MISLCNMGDGLDGLLPAFTEALFPDAVEAPDASLPDHLDEGADGDRPAAVLSDAVLDALSGEYRWEELGATWTLRASEGSLLVDHPMGTSVEVSTADGLSFSARGFVLAFDLAAGEPVGFTLQAGRVKTLRFERVRQAT